MNIMNYMALKIKIKITEFEFEFYKIIILYFIKYLFQATGIEPVTIR